MGDAHRPIHAYLAFLLLTSPPLGYGASCSASLRYIGPRSSFRVVAIIVSTPMAAVNQGNASRVEIVGNNAPEPQGLNSEKIFCGSAKKP